MIIINLRHMKMKTMTTTATERQWPDLHNSLALTLLFQEWDRNRKGIVLIAPKKSTQRLDATKPVENPLRYCKHHRPQKKMLPIKRQKKIEERTTTAMGRQWPMTQQNITRTFSRSHMSSKNEIELGTTLFWLPGKNLVQDWTPHKLLKIP